MLFLFYSLEVVFVLLCLLLIGAVLIQKGRGGGLSGAFGGAGGNTAFGAKTGDVLTWATSIIFGLFLVVAVFMNLISDNVGQPPAAPTVITAPANGAPVSGSGSQTPAK